MFPNELSDVEKTKKIEELKGQLSSQFEEDKLMHSILKGDKKKIDEAKLIEEGINNNVGGFTPDLMMQQLVQNYANAKRLYGETILRLLSSYNPDYIEKNIKIPEFQRELKDKITKKVTDLQKKKILNSDGSFSKKGEEMAALIMYVEEVDNLTPKGIIGEKVHKKKSFYGTRSEVNKYKKGDRYADLALKKSITKAIKRGHTTLLKDDLMTFERKSKGNVYVIYGLDASGSMKGKKIEAAKKAGIALAYKAIAEKDKVGMVVFESEIKDSVAPTTDFPLLLKKISTVRATKQTDMKQMIRKAVELFPDISGITKHLILLTDAMPTVGSNPEKETLDMVAEARAAGVTISLIGVGLEKKGEKLGKEITELGNGRFHIVKNLDRLDAIVLEDYYGYS
ncbi:VWA domain-containing protein [Candidatus Woesearchaeota archaeon]|jgi:Mg-chelatase subunit ChlD|nr:VWA domain-containing protein [Candidatus Woesearchaeota archaeon]MBT3304771.1 VWA domain-containing protein [Candidatus Woesearchaeota archaeon]MBT4367893.1 VWA domain-containing protein [Candidatus Woesearchaeota archaeon]MBT4712381.1 VWA domain-containing protein [Candidatus Woesearchaeota archaeon]MBT6639293.1 VWA domain-containing protein [Candidatus Woesearchaeota archaeon]